jgi:hypothetical protein
MIPRQCPAWPTVKFNFGAHVHVERIFWKGVSVPVIDTSLRVMGNLRMPQEPVAYDMGSMTRNLLPMSLAERSFGNVQAFPASVLLEGRFRMLSSRFCVGRMRNPLPIRPDNSRLDAHKFSNSKGQPFPFVPFLEHSAIVLGTSFYIHRHIEVQMPDLVSFSDHQNIFQVAFPFCQAARHVQNYFC